jgi:hypothetical protein
MPITTEPRYFGEGIYSSGEEKAATAFSQHRRHVRIQRLNDLLGKETKLDCASISDKFEAISAAIAAADSQVKSDNAAFIKKHSISVE